MGDGELKVGGGEVLELLRWGGGGDGRHFGADLFQGVGVDGENEGVKVYENIIDGPNGAASGLGQSPGAEVL